MVSPVRERGRPARLAARGKADGTPAVPAGSLTRSASLGYAAAIALSFAAVLSKENAVCVPLLILLVELLAFSGRVPPHSRARRCA
jgi:hypothetical protein